MLILADILALTYMYTFMDPSLNNSKLLLKNIFQFEETQIFNVKIVPINFVLKT